ncbi:efflux RND transporter periplasmic adaptor subunit, partial [Ramlibacter aquaticus]
MDEQNKKGPDLPQSPVPGLVEPPPQSRRTRLVGALAALVLMGGLGWLAWHLTHPETPAAQPGAPGARPGGGGPGGAGPRGPATTVGVAVAERADLPVVLEALGTVTPQATAKVRAQVTGTLQQVLFKEGQLVRQGEVLAQIDPRQFEMALQQATGARMKDEAQLQAAQVTLQRYRTLLQQDSIARQEVDTQEATVKQLEAALVVDRANEGTARLNLGYTRVVAPITGRVGLRQVDVGNVVSPGDANGVAIITQLQPIDVQFSVPQDQAALLQSRAREGMKAVALDRTRSTALETGVFASLDNQVDTATGTVKAKARFANAQMALFPSQFVNLRLDVQVVRDAVVVPVAALRHGNNGDFVFVLNEDRTVSQRVVKAGQATVDKVQIVQGLQLGERVITEGADRLRDGSRVVLPGEGRGTPGPGGWSGRRPGASAAAGGAGAAPQGASGPAAAD